MVREWGIDCLSKEKRFPDWTYGLPKEQVALLLNRFWSCDGSISYKKPQKAEVSLASEGLIDDLQALLLRLGVRSRKVHRVVSYRGDTQRHGFDSWRLTVTGAQNLLKFLDEVGDIFGKEKQSKELRKACATVKANSNTDVVPLGPGKLSEVLSDLSEPERVVAGGKKFGITRLLGRNRFQQFCTESGYQGEAAWLASSALVWERVKATVSVGRRRVYDLSVEGTHNFVGNGIVLHNSYITSGGMTYDLYRLLCLRCPQEYYGLAAETPLVMMNLSVTQKNAENVLGKYVQRLCQNSPWFEDHFYKGDAKRKDRRPTDFPEKNMAFMTGGSTEFSAIGENLAGGALDEANFMVGVRRSRRAVMAGELDQAQILYDGVSRRRQSRFVSRPPARLWLVSSKQFPGDFLERRMKTLRESGDKRTFIIDHPVWEPRLSSPHHVYSGDFFILFIGNATTRSYILDHDPVRADFDLEAAGFVAPMGCEYLLVPVEHQKEFEQDINGAIRDLAGRAILASNPFFPDLGVLSDAVCVKELGDINRQHPYEYESTEICSPALLRTERLPRHVDSEGRIRPALNPDMPRFAHIDLAKNHDAAGLVIGHFGGRKDIPVTILDIVKGPDGLPLQGEHGPQQTKTTYIEQRPIIIFDFKLRYVAPRGGIISPKAPM